MHPCVDVSLWINIQNNSLVQVNQSELLISRETVSFEMIFVMLFFGPLLSQTEVSVAI